MCIVVDQRVDNNFCLSVCYALCPLSSTEFVEPPPNKIPGYATVPKGDSNVHGATKLRWVSRKRARGCWLNSNVSGRDPIAGSSEHGHETSDSIKWVNTTTGRATVSFSSTTLSQ